MDPPATTTPPPVTAENHHPPPLSPPPSQSTLIKPEPQDSPTVKQSTPKDQQTTENPKSPAPASTQPSPSTPAASISLTELQNLSSALSSFQSCFSIIQHHIDNLKTAVDSCIITIPPLENANISILPQSSSIQQSSLQIVTTAPVEAIEEKLDEDTTKCEVKTSKDSSFELENLCKTMSGKGLKRYMVSNLSEISKLREQVPKALKLAQNPAKMIVECVGKFFLQGSKAYVNKDSPMVTGREASVLALECLLLMGLEGVEIEKEVKDEADQNALSWRKRIITEGGIMKVNEIDARGLLLLVGCFGVPKTFKIEDIRDLLRRSHIREISGALRKSTVLVEKVPEIIEGMIKSKMEIGAVDLAYTFGVEDKFNAQKILTSFLQESLDSSKNVKEAAPNEANKKKLAALKSVMRCLEDHKVDPSKLLPEWKISEKISTLKNDLTEFDKKKREEKTQKRKADEESAKKLKSREVKRSRQNGQGIPNQKGVGQVNNHRHVMNTNMPGHINSYSTAPSMLYAPAAGSSRPAGVYGGMMVDSAGHVTNHSAHAHAGADQYSPIYETSQGYGWRGDPAMSGRVVAHSYAGEPILTERVVAHNYAGQPSSSLINGLYRTSTSSLEGYAMAPNASSVGVSSRRASDLYQFADAVLQNEYQPPAGPTHHASYL